MKKIEVPAANVWKYFKEHVAELKKDMHLIAEEPEFGVEIYITADGALPNIIVSADDCTYTELNPVCETQCTREVEEIYDKYLTLKFLEDVVEDETAMSQEDMISERELELDDAFMNLIDTILEESGVTALGGSVIDEICEDLKDHTLEYLARKHELTIRRPMVMEDDETKEEFFEEYPYECMVYEDEDNPIYKNS